MGDSEFLAELEQRQRTDPVGAADEESQSRMTPRDRGFRISFRTSVSIPRRGPEALILTRMSHNPTITCRTDPPAAASRSRSAAFSLMTGLGAAAAAYVFHCKTYNYVVTAVNGSGESAWPHKAGAAAR